MVMDFSFGGNMGAVASSIAKILFYVVITILGSGALGFGYKKYSDRKKFNIPITIWIPRSDNKLLDQVQGKGGYFKSKMVSGITSFKIKRKGVTLVEIPPPASRFLIGTSKHLYLIQKGMDDFEPVLPDSFLTVETEDKDEHGNFIKKAIVDLKCVNQDATAWAFDNEENAKKRFTFTNLWDKYKDFIQITIFILIVFIASYIQKNGLESVADALKVVADQLKNQPNIPLVS